MNKCKVIVLLAVYILAIGIQVCIYHTVLKYSGF